jgi:hypothetical protein
MIYIKNISGSQIIVRGVVIEDNTYYEIQETHRIDWYNDESVYAFIGSDQLQIAKLNDGSNDIQDKVKQWEYLGNELPSQVEISTPIINNAFANKGNHHFRGTGKKFICAANTTTSCEFEISYTHVKFNGVNILNGNSGDTCNLKVLDNAAGTFSTVPNYTLDQFGFDWNITDSKELLPYVADLYQTMKIVIEYTNNTDSETEIFVNYYIHEE